MKKSNFIAKLETEEYLIGSFDAYLEESIQLLSKEKNISLEEAAELIKKMPTITRAAIISKSDGVYCGYIGVSNYNGEVASADLNVHVNSFISKNSLDDVVKKYIEYITNSLNIQSIVHFNDVEVSSENKRNKRNLDKKMISFDKKDTKEKYRASIQIARSYLKDTITEKELEIVKSWNMEIPRLYYARAVYLDGVKFVGIIGLSNLSFNNQRADLKIYLNPNLGEDLIISFGSVVVNEYLHHAHAFNIHNILSSATVNTMNDKLFNETHMIQFAEIPYTESLNGNLTSRILYQHTPFSKKRYEPKNIIYPAEGGCLQTKKTELSKEIVLDSNYRLARPTAFSLLGIDFENILQGHILAMQNRKQFTIPLGEDKYFLQRGNEKYGIYKSLSNFSYVVVDNQGNYAGYVNVLRNEGRHAEIEIGISPDLQAKGLGRKTIEAFYEELFSLGYASITSCVFIFNQPSLQLHEKVAELNGIRVSSYYMNGKLWDMCYYTKVNPIISSKVKTLK